MTDTELRTLQPVRGGPPVTVPRHRGRLVVLSMLAGVAVAVLWSAWLVDDSIGLTTANGLLGHDVATAAVPGGLAGLVFALVTGLAGTFTACNVAVFGAIAPMMDTTEPAAGRLRRALGPLGWIALGGIAVAGTYGAVAAAAGGNVPQLSTASVGGVPVRLLQAVITFAVIGLIMLYLGLAAASVVPDPLRRVTARWSPAPQLLMGVLVGAFLIGRPWPMFHTMFLHAARTHNVVFGAGALVLVVLGNLLVVGVLFLLLSAAGFARWLRAKPSRVTTIAAVALLVAGTFTLVYWGVRVPANFGIGWFPKMPWH